MCCPITLYHGVVVTAQGGHLSCQPGTPGDGHGFEFLGRSQAVKLPSLLVLVQVYIFVYYKTAAGLGSDHQVLHN